MAGLFSLVGLVKAVSIVFDFQTLEDNTVTIRERDAMQQERVVVGCLPALLNEKIGAT